jgi:hypothetical protein
MASTYKVLAQSAPSATTNTDVYTVGSGKSAVVSTITVCNRSASAATYRIAIRVAGATLANEDYIAYGATCPANDMIALTLGLTLAATDVVTVFASSGDLSFGLFGSEVA